MNRKIDRLWQQVRPVVFVAAFLGIVLHVIGFVFHQPAHRLWTSIWSGTWGTGYGIGQVLFKATPLMFTSVAFRVALTCGIFNIGLEGQVALSSLMGAVVASALPTFIPWPMAILLTLVSSMITAMSVALIPAVLKVRFRVQEIISFIMMNRIVDVLVPWILVVVLGAGGLRTKDAMNAARFMPLEKWVPAFRGSAVSVSLFLGFAVVVWVIWLSRKTKIGREFDWIGAQPDACRAEGLPVSKRQLQAMLLSAAIAGLVTSATVLGYKGYFEHGLGFGTGFSGIAVALLGRGSIVGTMIAALVLGTLQQGGLALNASVPREAMGVLEALAIVFVSLAYAPWMKSKALSPVVQSLPSTEAP